MRLPAILRLKHSIPLWSLPPPGFRPKAESLISQSSEPFFRKKTKQKENKHLSWKQSFSCSLLPEKNYVVTVLKGMGFKILKIPKQVNKNPVNWFNFQVLRSVAPSHCTLCHFATVQNLALFLPLPSLHQALHLPVPLLGCPLLSCQGHLLLLIQFGSFLNPPPATFRCFMACFIFFIKSISSWNFDI